MIIDLRFRFWALVAMAAKVVILALVPRLERFGRSLEWKAMMAHGPIYVRARARAGCKPGCTVELFPHAGKACFTTEDFMATYKKFTSSREYGP